MIENKALKYGYSNARVKAMKGLLLKAAFLDDLIKCSSIEAMIELLQRTPYKGEFAEDSVRYTGSEIIEIAASKNFAKTVEKLIRITPEKDKKILNALLLKYGLLNLKTIMHAKKIGRSYEEVKPHLLPAGGCTEEDIRRIMKADKGSFFREVKRTVLGQQMLAVQSERTMWDKFNTAMHSMDAFFQMETIIDSYIYLLMEKVLEESGSYDVRHIREMLRKEIDAKNVLIIERMKKHSKKNIRENLILGGTLSEQMLNKVMESKDLETTVKLVKHKFHKLELENQNLSDLEIAFEKAIAAQKLLAFHRGMLSVGVIIGFLLLKEEEVNNLRKIAKGKEFGMSEKDIRDMLVVV
jgi:V/A-type H+-transporting ATPase subunit C